jgi:hypothetical protein
MLIVRISSAYVFNISVVEHSWRYYILIIMRFDRYALRCFQSFIIENYLGVGINLLDLLFTAFTDFARFYKTLPIGKP